MKEIIWKILKIVFGIIVLILFIIASLLLGFFIRVVVYIVVLFPSLISDAKIFTWIAENDMGMLVICSIVAAIIIIIALLDKEGDTSNTYRYTAKTVSGQQRKVDFSDVKRSQFYFYDAQQNYRRYGDDFIDCKGRWCKWGGDFYDSEMNYRKWGDSFLDGDRKWRKWGDDFIDGAGNWVKF